MTDTKVIYIRTVQQFNHDTNRYVTVNKVIKAITEDKYNNMTSKETIKYFRKLGVTEKVTRKGGRVTRLVSTSPCGKVRTIRTFKFSE